MCVCVWVHVFICLYTQFLNLNLKIIKMSIYKFIHNLKIMYY